MGTLTIDTTHRKVLVGGAGGEGGGLGGAGGSVVSEIFLSTWLLLSVRYMLRPAESTTRAWKPGI